MAIRVTHDERFDGILVECVGEVDDTESREGMDALALLPPSAMEGPFVLDFGACGCAPLSASKHALSMTLMRAISAPGGLRAPVAVVVPPCGDLPGYNPARVRALCGDGEAPRFFTRVDEALAWIGSVGRTPA